MPFSRILIPIEGIPAEQAAIRLACQIARQDKSKIFAIHVIEVQRNLPLDAEDSKRTEIGEKILEQAEQIAHTARGFIEAELLQARVAGSALVNEAVERKVDLIIIGVPFRKPIGDFQLGATPSYILKNAPCPVWICRESAGGESGDAPKKK